ncbi:MAG TPA: hypothetical protein VJL80_07360, partial [Aeromicrobium sp.]
MAVYFDPCADNAQRFAGPRLVAEWLRIAGEYGPSLHSQVCKPIDGPTGWLKYLAKHGARSVAHYQRQGMPPGWDKTGRLWGSFGDWPVEAWHSVEVSIGQWNRHRRLAQRYLLAQARSDALRYEARGEWAKAAGSWDRVAYLRRARKCPDRSLSMCRGVSGWVPLEVSCALLAAVGWREPVAARAAQVEPLPVADPIEFAREWAAGQFGPIGL